MRNQTRHTLIQKVRNAHDEQSWSEFSDIYRPYIYVIIKNLGVPQSEIEDQVQSVLIICWQKIPELNYDPTKGRFRFWLSRIASYTVKNHIRKLKRREELSANFEIPTEIPAEIDEMSEKQWKVFIAQKAWDNIKKDLADKYRLCFEALLENRPIAEIAQELELAENSIYVYKGRIEKQLFKEIQRLKRELD